MNSNMDLLSKILIFATGAAIGSVVTYKLIKTKYEQIAKEEIESVKEMFGRKEKNIDEGLGKLNDILNKKEDSKQYEKVIRESGYSNYSTIDKKEASNVDKPYVIPPEEFGELGDEYEAIELTYYSDGILVDDNDEIIDDVDDIVGDDFEEHFGEYEDDSVFIRNDRLKCDYAIMRDLRNYSDVH